MPAAMRAILCFLKNSAHETLNMHHETTGMEGVGALKIGDGIKRCGEKQLEPYYMLVASVQKWNVVSRTHLRHRKRTKCSLAY